MDHLSWGRSLGNEPDDGSWYRWESRRCQADAPHGRSRRSSLRWHEHRSGTAEVRQDAVFGHHRTIGKGVLSLLLSDVTFAVNGNPGRLSGEPLFSMMASAARMVETCSDVRPPMLGSWRRSRRVCTRSPVLHRHCRYLLAAPLGSLGLRGPDSGTLARPCMSSAPCTWPTVPSTEEA